MSREVCSMWHTICTTTNTVYLVNDDTLENEVWRMDDGKYVYKLGKIWDERERKEYQYVKCHWKEKKNCYDY